MRPTLLLLLALVAAAPAFAGADPGLDASTGSATEIRLGQAPPPPPAVDPSRVNAVERFLAARQEGSAARAGGRAVKLAAMAPRNATAEELYGPKGARLVAFDFRNESIEPDGAGRFQVTAYLIFADEAGQVIESRDESLVFAGKSGAWSCASRQTTASISWESEGVLDTAASLGVTEELRRARAHLSDWTTGRGREMAFSVSDVEKDRDGRVVVQCLRFTADRGRRGFGVDSAPIVLTRDGGALRLESN